jgi:drug/metabolite transporter (DMT)-like permease
LFYTGSDAAVSWTYPLLEHPCYFRPPSRGLGRVKLESIGWRSAILAMVVSLLRGGNQVSLKLALRALTPFETAFARMAVSAVAVGVWGRARGFEFTPERREWPSLLNLTLLFVAQIGLLHYGADLSSPAYSVVLMNSNPIWANLLAHFVVPEDRLSAARVVGLAVAFSGICVVFLGRPDAALAPRPLVGNPLVLAAAVTAAIRTVYTQRLVQWIEPAKAVFWQTALSLPFFLLGTLIDPTADREPLSWIPVAGVLYQGLAVGALGLILWVNLLRKHSPGSLSVFSFSIPIFGMLLSAWLLSEHLTLHLLFGVAAVLSGIYLATRTTPAPQDAQPSE